MASASVNTAVRTIELFGSAYDEAAREDVAALEARRIDTSGLATGGGDLTSDRVITVPKATGADAAAGLDDTLAVTPLALATPLDAIEGAMALLAPLDSPAFTGQPRVPQAPLGTADDQAANTAFVAAALADQDWPFDLAAHLADIANPHQVTAAEVGLGAADNTADLDKPVSTATQAALNIVVADLDTVEADLVAHKASTANPHGTTAAQVGLGLVANLAPADLPVSTAQAAAIGAIQAEVDAAEASLAAHVADQANPHGTTASDVGLGAVDNTADLAKPISTATQTALTAITTTVTSVDDTLAAHLIDHANPHGVDADDVGLGLVANLAPLDLPISTATQAALNALAAGPDTVAADLAAHAADTNNPHGVDAADVGLNLVANLAPADLPVSTATQTAINALAADADTVAADLAAHVADTANPHAVDKADVGLGLVANLAPADLPVSNATQTALSALQVDVDTGQSDYAGHKANVANPHAVTKAQVGLGSVDNTGDLAKPISTATQTALNVLQVDVDTGQAEVTAHKADHANPHATTASHVGLGNVANLAPAALPVSTATQAALNAVQADVDAGQADYAGHKANVANPHAVTKSQVGLGLVANLAPADLPVSTATQAALSLLQVDVDTGQADYAGHKANVANPHAVTKSQVGLGAVDNTADLAKPVSTATQTAINAVKAGADATAASLAAHAAATTTNPHAVTKAQIGLSNVANLAPADLPVSTATQAALNALQTDVDTGQADYAGHKANVANPHAVTKAQIGLGSVANLAPAALPVSDATQAALNLKAPLASPALTGVPTAPLAAPGTASSQLATTGFVAAALGAQQHAARVTATDTPPANPVPGDLWFDTAASVMTYIWVDDGTSQQWLPTANQPGATGSIGSQGPQGVPGPTGPGVDYPEQWVLTPAAGATVDVPAMSKVVLNPAGPLATLTLRLPNTPDKRTIRVGTRQRIDALTITALGGQTVDWAVGELPRNGYVDLTLFASLNAWVLV